MPTHHVYCVVAFVFLSLASIIAKGQQNSKLKLDSLQNALRQLENNRISIDRQIQEVKQEINRLAEISHYENGKLKTKCLGGYLVSKPSTEGDIVAQVPKDGNVYIYPGYLKNGYLKADFGTYEGFIYNLVLEQSPALKALMKSAKNFSENEKMKDLISKYGERDGYRIYKKNYWIGMTKEMLIEMLGDPSTTNRTNFENEIREQLVYEKGSKTIYFYFTDNKLYSYQD